MHVRHVHTCMVWYCTFDSVGIIPCAGNRCWEDMATLWTICYCITKKRIQAYVFAMYWMSCPQNNRPCTSQGNMYIYTSDLKHGISTSRRGSNQFQNGTPFPPHAIPHTLIHMKNSPFITRSGLRRPKMPCTMGTTAPLDKG